MSNHDAVASFTDKWRARWPEWRVAEVFLPAGTRERAVAWFALRQELTDAAWGGADPQPGEAKLAWWAEELDGWAQGRRRHPLGSVLIGGPLPAQPLQWSPLAACLPSLAASRPRSVDATQARAVLEPFAEAVAGIAASLHACDTPAPVAGVVNALLAERLLQHGAAVAPLQPGATTVADDGISHARAWAAQLLHDWAPPHDGARAGRIHAAILRGRLQAFADGAASDRPLPSWRALVAAWRAARR